MSKNNIALFAVVVAACVTIVLYQLKWYEAFGLASVVLGYASGYLMGRTSDE